MSSAVRRGLSAAIVLGCSALIAAPFVLSEDRKKHIQVLSVNHDNEWEVNLWDNQFQGQTLPMELEEQES